MPVPSVRPGLRAAVGGTLAACVAVSAPLLLSAPSQASVNRITDEELTPAAAVTVHTSTGKTLKLNFDIDHMPSCRQCEPASTDFDLTLATPKDSEDHTWRLWPNSTTDFTLPTNGATGSVASGGEFGPYGVIDLTVTPVGDPDNNVCGTILEDSRQKVAITGSIFLDTRSNKWGTVGSHAEPLSISTPGELDTDYVGTNNCVTPGPDWAPCDFEKTWFVDGGVEGAGGTGKKAWFAMSADANLPGAPTGSYRDDEYSMSVGSATLKTKGRKATIKLRGNGSTTTGTATIKAGHRSVDHEVCGKKREPFVETTYWGKYVNGHRSLTLHSSMLGPVRLMNTRGPESEASIDIERKG